MNEYYLTLVFKPELEEKARKDLLSLVSKSAKITKEDAWGARDLAYPIKKNKKGFYIHLEFEAEGKEILGLDKSLKLTEDVIRYLLIRR